MFVSQWALGSADAAEALQLRRNVLMEELGWPDEAAFDAFDAYAAHLLVRVDGAPVAAARLYARTPGQFYMDHVCVTQAFRGQRYGDLCFRLLMDKAQRMGAERLSLRTAAQYGPYFEQFGFQTEREEDDGILLMQVNPESLVWPSQCGGQ